MKSKKITKKTKILLVFLLIILGILMLLVTHKILVKYVLNNKDNNDIEEITEEKINNELYDYKISNKATNYEKELFNTLKTIISKEEISYDDYAEILTKIFITDLFTLKNKKGNSDVRAVQYVYDEYQETFKTIVKESLYANIELDFDGTRTQQLPIVKEVIINQMTKEPFKLNNEIIDSEAFYFDVTINYEEDLGYPTNYKVVLVKKNNILQVVKSNT